MLIKLFLAFFILYFDDLATAAPRSEPQFDLYLPAANFPKKGKVPTLVFVHGGAWISGSRGQYAEFGKKLTALGYCVAVVSYRMAPEFKHPVPVQDLELRLRELESFPSKDCELKSLVLMGHSAGAHMIAVWASQHSRPTIKAYVGVAGIYDLPALSQRYPSYDKWFLNMAFGESKTWKAASPQFAKLKAKTPWGLFHSQADELVESKQSEKFDQALKDQKISSQIFLCKGLGHFPSLFALAEEKSDENLKLQKFLKEVL